MKKAVGSSYINHFLQPDTIIPDWTNPQTLNRYAYTLGNPVRYNDPSGHMVDESGCRTIGCDRYEGSKPKLSDELKPLPPQGRKPGEPPCKTKTCAVAKDLLTGTTIGLDGISVILSGTEAIFADAAYVIAGGVCATPGANVACPEALEMAVIVDVFLAGINGQVENAVGVLSTTATASSDWLAGNIGIDSDIGLYIGEDTIVSARNTLAGLIPESNVDFFVSVSQMRYDIMRASGQKSGGYVQVFDPSQVSNMEMPLAPPFTGDFLHQVFLEDWW